MYLLVRFVVEVLGKHAYAQEPQTAGTERWLARKLEESLEAWRNDTLRLQDWHTLLKVSQSVLDWDPYHEFAELLEMRYGEAILRRAAAETSRKYGGPTVGLIIAVADDFRERRLPAAVRGFDPIRGIGHEEAWLTTVFRWFLLRRASADRSVREQLLFFGPIESAPLRPDEILEQIDDELVAQDLLKGLHTLDAKYLDVLQRYFGLVGREHALREIASRYEISHHTARWLVVDALTALSVRLGVRRLLTKEEFAFAQLVFEKGMPTKIAAQRLDLSEHAIRSSIQGKFQMVLRKRTTVRHPEQKAKRRPSHLNERGPAGISQQPKALQMNRERIIAALRQLDSEPKISKEADRAFVSLRGDNVPLTDVRLLLAEDELLCDELIDKGVPLDWVFTSDGDRVDIFAGESALSTEIEEIASREWTVARFVLEECRKEVGERKLPILTTQSATEEPVARIVETLEGLSVALLRTIDAPLRQANPPLRIWQQNNAVLAHWNDTPDRFDLVPFVLRQALRFGEFSYDAATIVANTIARLLSAGAIPLPGFSLEEPYRGLQTFRPKPTTGERRSG